MSKKRTPKKTYTVGPTTIIRAALLIAAAVLVVLAVLAAVDYFALDGPTLENGSRAGQPITAALEKYKADHGDYPAALDLLPPDYLKAIPPAAPRYPFHYMLCSDPPGYLLSFRLGRDAAGYCVSASGIKGWTCSSAVFPSCQVK